MIIIGQKYDYCKAQKLLFDVGNVVGMSSMSDVTRKRITKTLSSSHDEIDTFWDLLWMDLTSTFQ